MNGLTVCGGWERTGDNVNTSNACKTLGPRGWETSHTLSQGRVKHVSWRTDDGILRMGGLSSETSKTTEVAGQDGSVAGGPFGLLYNTG